MDTHILTHDEKYNALVSKILKMGNDKMDRTGTGTLSLFGETMRFSLKNNIFPLITTKKVFWRGIVEELLWFISGSTDSKKLSEKGVKIWDSNGSKESLEKRGLGHYEEGTLGPVYGFQWRHFGAEYKGIKYNYEGLGVDQLKECIETIKKDPHSRRIVMTSWNPTDLPKMVLPPCHMFCQFYVFEGKLSCQMYQRSADVGLGLPFNIASYALLTRVIAHVTDLEPGEFIHVIGDAHIYKDHVDPLKEQLKRCPTTPPKLKINTKNKDIDSFKFEDFELIGYDPHPTIKMKMSI